MTESYAPPTGPAFASPPTSSSPAPTPRVPNAEAPAWRRSSLLWQIFLGAAAVIAVLVVTVLGTLELFARNSADAALARGLADAEQHVTALLDGRTRELASGAAVFAQNPVFRSLLLRGGPTNDLLDQAVEAAQRIGATWVQFTDADGLRLAKSDEPSAPVRSLAGSALVGGALAGDVTSGAGVVGDTMAIEGVAVPVTMEDSSSRVIGALVAARVLDAPVARALRDATESEVLVYFLDADGRPRLSASSLAPVARARVLDLVTRRRVARDSTSAIAVRLDGASWVGQETRLRDAAGGAVGGVLTLRSRDRELAPFLALRRRVLLAGAFGLLLAFGVASVVARRIARPILALRDAARRVAQGDLSVRDVGVGSSGEVGELADAVRSVLGQVHERRTLAELVERARAMQPNDSPTGEPANDDLATDIDTLPPGATLARRYVIDAVLGVGGNGVVYRATDDELAEPVAIKTLRPEVVHGGDLALARLKDEIRLARRISHAGVVRIHDLGEDDGTYFVTMEFVPGLSLAAVLRRVGRLPAPLVVALGRQLCSALAAAHAGGVIHRDVKPQNLMLRPDGALKVLDFGVARLAARTSGLTTSGLVVGTPAYMAPEQLLDEPVDARVDVYAAGVVLYEATTGRRPHDAPNPAALIARILSSPPPPPAAVDPTVPPALSDALARALARDPADRPPSAAALSDLLDRAARAAAQG